MTQEQVTSTANVIGLVLAILFIIALIMALVWMMVYCHYTDQMKQDYIKSLDEHDKAVIATYKNTYWTWRKKPNANKNVSH